MNAGRALISLLVLAGLAGSLISGAGIFARILFLGLLLALAARIWVSLVARSMRLSRQPEFWRASVGDIFKEQYEIQNSSRLRSGWIELYNQMPLPTAAGSRVLAGLAPHEKQTYVARSWLTRRGGFPLGPTRLTISDPLGLFRVQRSFPAERSLVVLPMTFPIKDFPVPPGLLPGGPVIRRKSMEITPHAAGVRSYVAGDPLKRIHWPTSARKGQLMVKEFDQDPQAEVWIFLDAHEKVQAAKSYETPAMPLESLLFSRKPKLTLPPSTLEYGISIAASLAHYFLGQHRAVGLVTQDRAYAMISPERSPRQESKILETLAFVEGKGNLSISALVGAHAPLLPQGSSVVLLTPTTMTELLFVADDLQRRNLRPIVILLDAESFGGRAGVGDAARRLAEQRVPVRLIMCGAELSTAISGFDPSGISQESMPWQRPPLSHLT